MVRAILDGRKTQTRRVIKPQPKKLGWSKGIYHQGEYREEVWKCPYGQPGDRLWVKESWGIQDCGKHVGISSDHWPHGFPVSRIYYLADQEGWSFSNRSALFMPRWASRITLEIISIKVERVQEISGLDCLSEGILPEGNSSDGEWRARRDYRVLWDAINKLRGYSWDSNPCVWCISFRKIKNEI